MSDYRPPFRDIRFTIEHLTDYAAVAERPEFGHADIETVAAVLEEAGKFMADVVAPLNRVGDTQGSRLTGPGEVTTPDGFPAAYRQMVDAGWGGVPFDPAYGGGGFPWTVGLAIQEMLSTASMAFSLCPLLTQGAIDMLSQHGSEILRETWLPKMVTGEWSGTMNLTEPDAGSDVGALRAKAEPAGDGTYLITGQKIFISYGEQDLTENIVHLVLARTPGAPAGTKGISCFVVPKFLLDDTGRPSTRNALQAVSLEHKMGLHASPTCVMSYDSAVGYLIGEENQGMRYMFTMMNNARLSVGLEGLALSERSYQQALQYAQDRRQGRAVGASSGPSPIIDHADVRRMLMTMRAHIDAMRGILYANSVATDLAHHGADVDTRTFNDERVALLTPISKGWCTDVAVELTSIGLQVHGGMGYVEETGAAQHFRDARIPPIYEGTNGIQAIDLVARKLPMRGGGVIGDFLAEVESAGAAARALGAALGSFADRYDEALASVRRSVDWLLTNGSADPNQALAGATPFLRMLGLLSGAWVHARAAVAACAGAEVDSHLAAKVTVARFYGEQILPAVVGLEPAVCAGAETLFALDPAQLGS